MGRIHWFEIHDQPWFPAPLRDALTDILEAALHVGNNYGTIVPRLRSALARTGAGRIVDLCSGGGGPWPRMYKLFAGDEKEHQPGVSICLTDKFPNLQALERVRAESKNQIEFRAEPVDATAVPPDLCGFRTLFTSFHHFRPADARAILGDAVKQRAGIGVFEVTHRSVKALLLSLLAPLMVLVLVPFMRPFRWSRLLWTYLIPILPLVAFHDAVASCFRTYSPQELQELVRGIAGSAYSWEIGEQQGPRSPLPITYLIGVPK